jgi:hypothetical protein
MIYIQFTGKGWLTYAIAPLTIVVGVLLGFAAGNVYQDRYVAAGVAAVAIAVIGGPVQWLVGRRLNGAQRMQPWERAEHTTYGIPMERVAPFYPAIGLLALAIVVGQATSPVWGWLLFLAAATASAIPLIMNRRS